MSLGASPDRPETCTAPTCGLTPGRQSRLLVTLSIAYDKRRRYAFGPGVESRANATSGADASVQRGICHCASRPASNAFPSWRSPLMQGYRSKKVRKQDALRIWAGGAAQYTCFLHGSVGVCGHILWHSSTNSLPRKRSLAIADCAACSVKYFF